ncbi:quinone oxidoreductase [Shewanella mangrovi]|uniref:Quinone oxidoreductase n=1 Tax=Shewanella mangrovi TaxID=1515746 RepID=A0A094JJR3_9GAMM|nr:MDR family oxidoreductase [Shewanella mangrovi]KFZ38284.1 quinone oxidoreductase [Shewanella mangrovi]
MFKALLLQQTEGKTSASVTDVDYEQLPDGEVTVKVAYSSLNYKDGLAITGWGKIIRQFPMVPGIDFVGQVVNSSDVRYQTGDWVILTGWGVGENHWGGMAEFAKVKADWLVPMPRDCDVTKAMMIGTAGLTAMLCVQAIMEDDVTPDSGAVLVTGASGGVGSAAVTLLSALGYQVTASTGRIESNGELLRKLGANDVISRDEFTSPGRPLDKQRWAAVIDTVGEQTLATALAQLKYGGVAAICGLVGGYKLPTTVMPFILRGISLRGIDSVYCPTDKRIKAWNQALDILPETFYNRACQIISLTEVPKFAFDIINGNVTGRTIIKIS